MDLSEFMTQVADGPPADIAVELLLTPAELDDGCTKTVDVDRTVPCTTCTGVACDACKGTGHTSETEQQGMFVVHQTCKACKGGTRYPKNCGACSGEGALGETETVQVAIPREAEAGMVVRITGKGLPARGEHPASDLYVTLMVDTEVPMAIVRAPKRPVAGFALTLALVLAAAAAVKYLL